MTKKPSAANSTSFEYRSSPATSWSRRLFTALLAGLMLLPGASQAIDTICAKVKIEIVQELTMERQGFDAMMKITNGLTASSLDNVAINVNFLDEAGKLKSAS